MDKVVVDLALLQVLINDVECLGFACLLGLDDNLLDANDRYDLLDHVGMLAICSAHCFLIFQKEPRHHFRGRVLLALHFFLLVWRRLLEQQDSLHFHPKHDQHFQRLSALLLLALTIIVVSFELLFDPAL